MGISSFRGGMQPAKQAARGFLSAACAVALAASLVPSAPVFADEAPFVDEPPSIEQLLAAGPFVEGEALVVYRSDDALRAQSAQPTNPFDEQGAALKEVWDFSALLPDEQVQDATSNPSLSNDNFALQSARSGDSSDQEKIALVSKAGANTAELLKQLESLDFVEVVSPNYLHEPIGMAPYELAEATAAAMPAMQGFGAQVSSELAAQQPVPISASSVLPVQSGPPSTNDPLLGMQWALENDLQLQKGAAIDSAINRTGALVEQALSQTDSRADNIVAVVDTGIDSNHVDLQDVMWEKPEWLTELPGKTGAHGYDFGDGDDEPRPSEATSYNSHGSHCAGIIAAEVNNATGISGVSPRTKIMDLKVVPSDLGGAFRDSALVSAFAYIFKARLMGENIVAVNNSWGDEVTTPVLEFALEQLGRAGVLSVFAGVNSGDDISNSQLNLGGAGLFGNDSPFALSVAASAIPRVLTSFSSYNRYLVDVAAPGSAILSTVATGAQPYLPAVAETIDKAQASPGEHSLFYNNLSSLYSNEQLVPGVAASVWELVGEEYVQSAKKLTISKDRGLDGREALRFNLERANPSDAIKLEFYLDNPFAGTDWSVFKNARVNVLPGVSVDEGFVANSVTAVRSTLELFASDASSGKLIDLVDAKNSRQSIALADEQSLGDTVLSEEGLKLAAQSKEPLLAAITLDMRGTMDGTSSGAVTLTDFGIGFSEGLAYDYFSGTSMAAPYVAGSVALLASLYPDEGPLQLRGRIIGATKPLNSNDGPDGLFPFAPGIKGINGEVKRIAQQGTLNLPTAVNSAHIQACTWGASLVGAPNSGGHMLAIEGYALAGAALTIDGNPIPPSAFMVDDAGNRLYLSDASLMDGGRHTVVVGKNGGVHEGNYAFPLPAATRLEEVASLPRMPAYDEGYYNNTGWGTMIAAADRLFYLDEHGAALYSFDPQAPDSSWKRCQPPRQSHLDTSLFSPFTRGAYANGKLYLLTQKVDLSRAWSEELPYTGMVGVLSYDIAADVWADEPTWLHEKGTKYPGYAFSTLGLTSLNGSLVLSLATDVSRVAVVYDPAGGSVTKKALGDEDAHVKLAVEGNIAPMFQVGDAAALATLLPIDAESDTYGLSALLFDGTGFSTQGVSESSPLGPRTPDATQMSEYLSQGIAATGDSLVFAGTSAEGLGSVYALRIADNTWSSLDVRVPTEVGYTTRLFSACFYRGNYYVLGAGKDMSGQPEVVLYRMPDAVAETFAANDYTAEVEAGEGGSAVVLPASGMLERAAQVKHVPIGDTVAWEAVPAQGYVLEGWYDAQGVKVRSETRFEQPVTADVSLEARFVPAASTNPPAPGAPGAPGDPSDPAGPGKDDPEVPKHLLTNTGDPVGALALVVGGVALLSLLALVRAKRLRRTR